MDILGMVKITFTSVIYRWLVLIPSIFIANPNALSKQHMDDKVMDFWFLGESAIHERPF